MNFVEERFPTDISYGSAGGPEYSTDVVTTHSGHEKRNVNWESARARYNVAHGVKNQSQLDTLIAFFRARKGRAYGFRFKDWTDFTGVNQFLGTGDATQTVFQLQKIYSNGGANEIRAIHKPVAGTVNIYLDSLLQESGVTVNAVNGEITFSSAPGDGVSITADFEFDVPVRFDTDRLSARLENYNVYTWQDIPLIEIRMS